MSKETSDASPCACGQMIVFHEQHWPHCPANPDNLDSVTRSSMEARFSKSELAIIASHGPIHDRPIRNRRLAGAKTSARKKEGR